MNDTGTIQPGMTLDDITNRHPETMEVFNRFGMDICCGGGATLSEAAERDGVPLRALSDALEEIISRREAGSRG